MAFNLMSYSKRELEDLKEKIAFFERKYKGSYDDFAADIPDTVQGHDDWIEWTYLTKAAQELSSKINKLSFLMGEMILEIADKYHRCLCGSYRRD